MTTLLRALGALAIATFSITCTPSIPKYSVRYAEKRASLAENGLRMVVIPDKNTPMVHVAVRYEVGANEDPPGKAGLAHLVEHMMFQHRFLGADKPPTFELIPQIATGFNAYTTWDQTHYYLDGRKEDLDAMLRLEAARMGAICNSIPPEQFDRELDVVRNEITAHAVAALHAVPDVTTVLEIGGQDSKVILLSEGIPIDFAMNTVCAAGTGSFLDHQAARLGIPVEEFGTIALTARQGARIAGRCGVFAESDMIHKQQVGYPINEIVYGLCQALVRNYLNNLAKGKDIAPPVVFQGGVAANIGMKRAFEEALGVEVIIPPHHNVMGAIGAALLSKRQAGPAFITGFKGFSASDLEYRTSSFGCKSCSNNCEIVRIKVEDETLASWGGRCDRWETAGSPAATSSRPV